MTELECMSNEFRLEQTHVQANIDVILKIASKDDSI